MSKSEKLLVDSILEEGQKKTNEDPMEKKLSLFSNEIEAINDPKIRSFVRSVLKMAEPFWVSPASMVEGMHPLDEYGPEGLIIHTKRVFRVTMLMTATVNLTTEEADCLLAAALLHDVTKAFWVDEEQKIVSHDSMHPYTVDTIVKLCKAYDEDNNTHPPEDNTLEIDQEHLEAILRLIRHSHGLFSPIPETYPTNEFENILHIADLVAANLHLIVDGYEVIKERWLV